MKFFYKEQKVRNGYIAAFVLLMISYFLVFFILRQMEKRAKLVDHTSEIINNLDILLSCIKESETNFRSFIIMNDSALLEPYRYNMLCIESSFSIMNNLFEENTIQLKYLDSLSSAVEANSALMDTTIYELRMNAPPDHQVMFIRLSLGMQNLNKIRNFVFTMQTNETERLASTSTEFDTTARTLKIIHLTTFIIASLLLVYSVLIFNSISIEKLKYRAQLEEGIEKLKIANNDLISLRSMEKFAASGRIARAIAHEVRNPLTSISLAIEQLNTSILEEEDKSLLEIISRGINRIRVLIQELLNSTKFSQLKLSRVSLNKLVDDAIGLAQDRIELNGIKVIRNPNPDSCIIDADAEKMKVALLNLLINAVEAMEPNKGVLEVITQKENGKCTVMIRDNGIGMDENELTRIFEPFFTQKEHGNGLGLTLTQNIILNHKGNITVESKPKYGTTFTIFLNQA